MGSLEAAVLEESVTESRSFLLDGCAEDLRTLNLELAKVSLESVTDSAERDNRAAAIMESARKLTELQKWCFDLRRALPPRA